MWYSWPAKSVVRIVTSDIFAGDAIGNFNLQLRDFLRDMSIPSKLYASNFDPANPDNISLYDQFFEDYTPDDVLLSHFSIFEEKNYKLRDVSIPKAVYFHGITPPEYFSGYDEITEANCSKGLQQFSCFEGFDYYLSNSRYMLEQLLTGVSRGDAELAMTLASRSEVIPPFVFPGDTAVSHEIPGIDADMISLLYVGRIAPHKCVIELIDILVELEDRGAGARLDIVGGCAAPLYCEKLNQVIDSNPAIKEKVTIYGFVDQSRLEDLYSSADVFVTMSEHEGFCVPLVEAMKMCLPIVAKGRGAVPDTLGRSGMLFYEDEPSIIADHIISLQDSKTYQDAVNKQLAVLSEIESRADGTAMLAVLEKLVRKNYG